MAQLFVYDVRNLEGRSRVGVGFRYRFRRDYEALDFLEGEVARQGDHCVPGGVRAGRSRTRRLRGHGLVDQVVAVRVDEPELLLKPLHVYALGEEDVEPAVGRARGSRQGHGLHGEGELRRRLVEAHARAVALEPESRVVGEPVRFRCRRSTSAGHTPLEARKGTARYPSSMRLTTRRG